MMKTSFKGGRFSSPKRIAALASSVVVVLAAMGSLLISSSATTLSGVMKWALNVPAPALPIPVQKQTSTLYLHGTGPNSNPPTLFLNTTAPTASTEKFKDSTSISLNGGNPWKEVGTWPAAPAMLSGNLVSLNDLHVWLGLKNSDDQGTNFDVRIEAYKNSTLVASGQSLCITGITRNAANAKEVTLSFDPFAATAFNGTSDVLSLKVLTRVGTDASGNSCGGHSNAVGLRLYFDAVARPSRFNATQTTDTTPPVLAVEDPVQGLVTNLNQILVQGTYSDASPVTITVNGVSTALSNGNFTATVPLNEGQNTLNVIAVDEAGNQSALSVSVTRDSAAPVLTVEQPPEGAVVTESLLTVAGTFNDPQPTIVTINDNVKSLPAISGNQFSATIQLVEGSNTLTIRAIDKAGNVNQVVRTVLYQVDHTPPNLLVTEPVNGAVKQTIAIAGTVTTVNPPVTVSANGNPLLLNPDGSFSGALNSVEGANEIQVRAVDKNNNQTTITRTVIIDTTAPTIAELSPAAGTLINATSVSIQGRVTDATTVSVSVNGVAASVGSGGLFSASNVPINEGETEFVIKADDAAGNSSSSSLVLIGKDNTAPSAPEVFAAISPTRLNFQTIEGRAEPGSQVIINGAAQPVTADAAFGTGLFAATISLTAGSNVLTLTARDSSGNVSPATQLSITSDTAMALPPAGQAAQINVSTGNAQRGLVNTELPRPVIAIVTDRTGDPVSGVTVQFTMKQGGGRFVDGTDVALALTDSNGRASVRYISGTVAGIQIIRADYTGNASTPATFTAEALESTGGVTSVSGVVQDQNLRALPNVLVRIAGQETRTGPDGRFMFTNIPTGPHQLLELIGRDQITLPGRWPNISYDFDVLPGVVNDLGRPLFLPKVNTGVSMPLDANNVVTQDTTFELPVVGGEPPIRVTAKAGTHVIFPPDVTDKRLSVTRIATNRTPMVLEDGRATNLYISVQPSGAIFETPLQVSFPNIDRLPANQEVLLMSFNHDVGRYVKVGTGHVSADGRVVSSDPGNGIRVGAWGALPPIPPQPEVTVLGHIQLSGNPAFDGKLVRVKEAWVEGQQAQLVTAASNAPRWDYRATLTLPEGTTRLAKMEASVVATDLSLNVGPLVPPGGVAQSTQPASARSTRAHHARRTPGAAATTQQPPANSVFIAVGQSVEQDASANPPPEPGDDWFFSFQSNATNIATVEFAPGFNAKSHPNKGLVKGIAPGVTRFSITYVLKCRNCWLARPVNKQVQVTVIGASSINAELPSTGSGTQSFVTANQNLAFPGDIMVVMQNSGPIKLKLIALNPTSTADLIRWQVERNPDDTVDTGLPDFTDSGSLEFTVTPNRPGNFRITAYVDTYKNNTRYEGQHLRVLMLAVVRATPQPNHSIGTNPTLTATGAGVDFGGAMNLQINVLLEGGGVNRTLGVSSVTLGNVGNVVTDNFVINYPVPTATPTPTPPGNVPGTVSEDPGGPVPMLDTFNSAPGHPAGPGAAVFRSHSVDNVVGPGPNGLGILHTVTSSDAPGFGGWAINHPVTNNPWTTTQGGNTFREYIVAFTGTFNRNYVVIARGDWTVTARGRNSSGTWTDTGSSVTVQGVVAQPGTAVSRPMTVFATPQAGTTAGVQVLGLSFVKEFNYNNHVP